MTEATRTVKTQDSEAIDGIKHIKPKCGTLCAIIAMWSPSVVDESEARLVAQDILGGRFRCPTSNDNVLQLQRFADPILIASRTMVFKKFVNFFFIPSSQ